MLVILRRSPIDNEMPFTSRLRIKKNIALPINENANLNQNYYYNPERNYSNGQIRNSIPVPHLRRAPQNVLNAGADNEMQTQYASMNPADISTTNVGCIIPSKSSFTLAQVTVHNESNAILMRQKSKN